MGGVETHLQNLISGLSSSEDVRLIVAGDAMRGRIEEMDGAVITRVGTLGLVVSMPVTPTLRWKLMKVKPALVHAHGIAAAYCVEKPRGTTRACFKNASWV